MERCSTQPSRACAPWRERKEPVKGEGGGGGVEVPKYLRAYNLEQREYPSASMRVIILNQVSFTSIICSTHNEENSIKKTVAYIYIPCIQGGPE